MRGAMAPRIRRLHRTYYLPSMTGIATAIYEDDEVAVDPADVERVRNNAARQLAGVETLQGTYPFDFVRSVKAYRLNDFLHRLVEPAHRKAFLDAPEALFETFGLTGEERDLLRRRDWRGMIHYGVIFFILEKLAAAVGTTNQHIYAAMRGESLEAFQKTRKNAVLYSVAGTHKRKSDKDSPAKRRPKTP